MARKFIGTRLVIASHNRGKIEEFTNLLEPFSVSVITAEDFGLSEPEEPGPTFSANAQIKALRVTRQIGLPSIGDDSGLVVRALNNMPGLHSARWAGPNKDFFTAMTRVNEALGSTVDRSASFVCAIALAWPDGHIELAEGNIHGFLVWPPRGDKGFGYDPMFRPIGYTQTFGEMIPTVKITLSHRTDAFRRLTSRCFSK